MTHVVQHPHAPLCTRDGKLHVHQLTAATDNLVWALVPSDGSGIAVVDGPDASAALAFAESIGQPLVAVFNTHTHGDHIGINRDLERRSMLPNMRVVGPSKVAGQIPGLNEAVWAGDSVDFGGSRAQVLVTEGHLDGHISYSFPGVVFCGDTLFAGGCGYLFDGPPQKMFDSLQSLARLPADTLICCAHEYTQDNLRFAWSVEPGNAALRERIRRVWPRRAAGHCVVPSTLAEEIATNPFLRSDSPELRERVARLMPEAKLETAQQVFAATRALKDRKLYKALGDAPLPL